MTVEGTPAHFLSISDNGLGSSIYSCTLRGAVGEQYPSVTVFPCKTIWFANFIKVDVFFYCEKCLNFLLTSAALTTKGKTVEITHLTTAERNNLHPVANTRIFMV